MLRQAQSHPQQQQQQSRRRRRWTYHPTQRQDRAPNNTVNSPAGGVVYMQCCRNINEVTLRQAQLVLRLVTIFGRVYHLGM